MPAFWDTPITPWLPILVIQIRSQVKTRQSQSYKFKKIPKNQKFWNFSRNIACDTPSEAAWQDVWIWNWSNQNCRHYRADTGCRTDGQTDGRSEINIPPTTSLWEGYNWRHLHNWEFMTFHYTETQTNIMPGHNLTAIHQMGKHSLSAGTHCIAWD